MSIDDFREIFRRETEEVLARLSRKEIQRSHTRSHEGSLTSPAASSAASRPGGSPAGAAAECSAGSDLMYLGELRRLAMDMAESVLHRVSVKAASWADDGSSDEAEPPAAEALRHAAEAEGETVRAQRKSRLQELQAELERKKAEEAHVRAELITKCKVDSDRALQAQEEQLTKIRQQIAGSDSIEDQREASELQQEIAEHVSRIRGNVALAKETIGRLEGRMRSLEQIEGQQQRPLAALEALLAGATPGGSDVDVLDDLDNPLVEAIRRGEQVCKRMRRSLAGA